MALFPDKATFLGYSELGLQNRESIQPTTRGVWRQSEEESRGRARCTELPPRRREKVTKVPPMPYLQGSSPATSLGSSSLTQLELSVMCRASGELKNQQGECGSL